MAELQEAKEREERLVKADLEKLRVEEAELESQQSAAATETLSPSTSGPSGKACPPA